MNNEEHWHKCDQVPFFAKTIDGNYNPTGQAWRRRVDGKWQYQQDPETEDEIFQRQF